MARSPIRFDSDALPPDRRFAAYQDFYARGTDAIELGPNFAATMTGAALDRAVLYDRRLTDVGHERTAARCERDQLDHFTLTLTVSGDFQVDSGEGFQPLPPGEMVLLDLTKPMRNRASEAHIITMSIARDRVVSLVGRHIDRLNGHRIPASKGLLLRDHLQSLVRHATDIPEATMVPLSRITIDFLSTAIDAEMSDDEMLRQQAQRWRTEQIISFIEANLSDPHFGLDQVVDRFGISRATLYRDFQPHGGFVRYVRRRRLAILRNRLADITNTASIADLARVLGFDSEAQASEEFVAEYGIEPDQYRSKTRNETELNRSRRRFGEWTADLQ
jgi:AraC-like DNA-binding protein